jgi:acetyl-CoA carboxylase biotin carboxyl carrier protein
MKQEDPQSHTEATLAEGESSIPGPFDLRTIRYLTALMDRFDMTEIDLREGDLRIRLRRGPKRTGNEQPGMPMSTITPVPTVVPTTPPVADQAAHEKPAKLLLEIKSPTPGTFYASSKPDAEPYVRIGSRVQKDTVVCIIEAMKVFNEITADLEGVIVAIQVENQQPVEYGQVLFKVDPTG